MACLFAPYDESGEDSHPSPLKNEDWPKGEAFVHPRRCYNPHDMDLVGRFINHHSFSLFAAASLVLLAVYLFRDGIQTGDLVAFGALVLGLVIAYGFLKPGSSTLSDVAEVEAKIGAGQPVLLEFQSPY